MPWVSVLVRKVYGVAGAGHGDGSRLNLRYAWPSGNWGSLPMAGGLEAAYRRELEAAEDPEALRAEIAARLEAVTSPFRTAERFSVEEIIDPRDTRPILCDWAERAHEIVPPRTRSRPADARPASLNLCNIGAGPGALESSAGATRAGPPRLDRGARPAGVLARGLRRDAARGAPLGARGKGATIRWVLNGGPSPAPRIKPPRVDGHRLDPVNEWGHDMLWWLDRMVRTQRPLQEKLTLFWHDHFATRDQDTPLMLAQNRTLRRHALGPLPRAAAGGDDRPGDAAFLSLADSDKEAPTRTTRAS